MTGALMAADHDGNSTVLFVGGIIIVITAVVIVLGSDSLAVVIAASIMGTTGMALLAQSYGHGVAMGAAVYLALTGLMATWLLSAIVNRLGPFGRTGETGSTYSCRFPFVVGGPHRHATVDFICIDRRCHGIGIVFFPVDVHDSGRILGSYSLPSGATDNGMLLGTAPRAGE